MAPPAPGDRKGMHPAHGRGCHLIGGRVGDKPPHKQWLVAVGVVSR